MKNTVEEIQQSLHEILKYHIGPLRVRDDNDKKLEVCGTIEAMQGKQKVDGYYFASVIPKPKDCRLYFFPIYTHVDQFELSEGLKKMLKGKSCFHIKKMSPEIEEEIRSMVAKGVELYKSDGVI